tara:strand:+ start:446 stop:640 length:195 start_codon:yes stop_codon:yes gene_type:complete
MTNIIPVEKINPTKEARLVNWRVVFEYEDGSEKEMYEVLDDKEQEYIDDAIGEIIRDTNLWKVE